MLASEIPERVTRQDILTLLDGLKSNVKHTDDFNGWVSDEDDWTDGKVYACLERMEAMLQPNKALQIEESEGHLRIKVNGTLALYNLNLVAMPMIGIARERVLAYVLSQDFTLLELFVEDWKRKGGDILAE